MLHSWPWLRGEVRSRRHPLPPGHGRAASLSNTWAGGAASRAAIAAAILIGDRSGLSDEDQRRLQEAGTYHVIAISGGTSRSFTTILLGALRVARVPSRIAAVVTIAALVLYGQLTGSSASVMRAVTGACSTCRVKSSIIAAPPSMRWPSRPLPSWRFRPLAVFDAGFVLSFGATLGHSCWERRDWWPGWWANFQRGSGQQLGRHHRDGRWRLFSSPRSRRRSRSCR